MASCSGGVKEKAVYFMYLVGFLDLLAVSLLIPQLPKFIKSLGASPTIVGIIGSTYGGLQLFSSPAIGHWSDLAGCKKVFLWTLPLTAFSYACLGGANTALLVFLCRIPAGCFKHSQELIKTFISVTQPKEKHTGIFGNLNAASSIGFIIGPMLGGHLAELPSGFTITALVTGTIFVIMSVIIWLVVPDDVKKVAAINDDTTKNHSLNFLSFLKDFKKFDWTNLWDIFLVRFLMGFAVMVYRSNFTLMMDAKFETSAITVGYITSYTGLVGTLCGFLVGRISNYYKNDSKLLTHTCIIQFVSIIGLTFAPSLWMVCVFLTPLGMANAVARVCSTKLTIYRGHGQEIGALLGLGASVLSVGRMMSPALGGIAQELHMAGPGVLGSFASGIGVITLLLVPHKHKTE